MTSIRSWQVIGSPVSAKTKAAASSALSFLPVGAAVGSGAAGEAAAVDFAVFAARAFLGGLAPAGAFAEVLLVLLFWVAMTWLLSVGVPRSRHRGRRGAFGAVSTVTSPARTPQALLARIFQDFFS